jgi:hypothetical protein
MTLRFAGLSATEGQAVRIHVSAVPEPETYAMLLAGLGLVTFAAYRRRQRSFCA